MNTEARLAKYDDETFERGCESLMRSIKHEGRKMSIDEGMAKVIYMPSAWEKFTGRCSHRMRGVDGIPDRVCIKGCGYFEITKVIEGNFEGSLKDGFIKREKDK